MTTLLQVDLLTSNADFDKQLTCHRYVVCAGKSACGKSDNDQELRHALLVT
jgi:hypothetical protein